MALDITVNGVSRNEYVRYRSLRIEKQGARETCRLEFLDHDLTAGALRPDTGAELHITRDASLEYGGEITRVTDQRLDGGIGGGTVTIVESRGWYFEAADVRIPVLILPAQTLQESVEHLLATYLDAKGWTNLEGSPGGPMLPLLVYVNQSISDIFDDLTKKTGYPWRVNGDRELAFTAAGTLVAPHTYDDSNSIVLRGASWTKDRVRRATRLVITTGGTGEYVPHHEDHAADGVKTHFPVNVLPIEAVAAVNNAAGYAATSTSIAVSGLPKSYTIKAGRTFRFAGHGLYALSADATTNGAGEATLAFTPGLAQAVVDDQALTFDSAALVTLEVGGTPTALAGAPWSFDAEQALFSTSGAAPSATDVTYRTLINFPARVRCWADEAQNADGSFAFAVVRDSELTWPEYADVALTKAAGDTELSYRTGEPKELRIATFAQDVYPWMLADCDFASRLISGKYLVQSVVLTDVGKRNQDPRVELVLLEGTSIGRDWRAFWMGADGGAVFLPAALLAQAVIEIMVLQQNALLSQAVIETLVQPDTSAAVSQAVIEVLVLEDTIPDLPTSGLTAHFDASVSDDLFTTFVSGGPHTGTPSDGSNIAVWADATGAARIFKQQASNTLPDWRETTPLLPLPCLDFSSDRMEMTNHSGTAIALSSLITASAYTLLIAFYPEAITSTNNTYNGEPIIGDTAGYWGVFLAKVGGVPKVIAYNYVSSAHYVEITCTEAGPNVVMVRHESGSLYMSVDGGSESSVSSGNTGSVSGSVRLGRGVYGSGVFDGRIGELAIYNTALSGADLSDAIAHFTSKWL